MEVYTPLKPKDQWRDGETLESLEEAMQAELTELLPTAVVSYTQPIQMRIEELISGVRATLALKVYGNDLGELDRLGAQLKATLAASQAWLTSPSKPTLASHRCVSMSIAMR